MRLSRAPFLPLLLVFLLLFAQQAGAMHTLHHALEGQAQHDKQAPNSVACEQCACYTQLGNALSVGVCEFAPAAAPMEAIQQAAATFFPALILAAAARGPPVSLQTY